MGIGTKLTELMKQQNTNANELAQRAGVPATTVYSLIKRDSNRVDIDSLIKIARALGVTADYFGNDTDSVPQPPPSVLAAHFTGDEYTEDELKEIYGFAEFVRSKRKS